MTQLQYFTALGGIWLTIAWLPYILDRIMVRGLLGGMANPSPDDKPQSPWAQRAHRAHIVGVELYVAFAPLSILAMLTRPEDTLPGTLAMIFVFGMVAHYVIYLLGIPVLRTLAFACASLSCLALGLRLIGVI
ncbi:MAG: MAPEG family protein [Rhodobacteraceae bacterium]|nr:MAPEG family protein [Paracoccaceae bacterium]